MYYYIGEFVIILINAHKSNAVGENKIIFGI